MPVYYQDHQRVSPKTLNKLTPKEWSNSIIQSKIYAYQSVSKRPRIFAQEPGRVSGDYGENFHRGLAVLVGLIIKLSP